VLDPGPYEILVLVVAAIMPREATIRVPNKIFSTTQLQNRGDHSRQPRCSVAESPNGQGSGNPLAGTLIVGREKGSAT